MNLSEKSKKETSRELSQWEKEEIFYEMSISGYYKKNNGKSSDYTNKEELIKEISKKIQREYDDYMEWVLTLEKVGIMNSAFEIVLHNAILNVDLNKYSLNQLNTLNDTPNPLSTIYNLLYDIDSDYPIYNLENDINLGLDILEEYFDSHYWQEKEL